MLAGVQERGAAKLRIAATLGEVTKPCDVVMQQPTYPQQSGEDTEVCSETLQVQSTSSCLGYLSVGMPSAAEI